ncbi:MAG: DUF5690 family protein [Saprospiraceae bacterium]
MNKAKGLLRTYLAQHEWALISWAGGAAFLSYCCMYMFRKPYTAAIFAGEDWLGIDYKIALVIAQVIGYALSKFLGIKLISELKPERRVLFFLGLIGIAFFALVGFAFSPAYLGVVWLLLNGLPLGMIWGIVFSYLEGRKWTEILTVIISVNFIFSSGLAKSIGSYLLGLGISEYNMPMMVGLLFLPLLYLSLWMLGQIPPPSPQDVQLRQQRLPMNGQQRFAFFKKYAVPIGCFIILYLLLTIVRDIRDNFAVELWTGLGFVDRPDIFITTEVPVTLLVFFGIGFTAFIKSNKKALGINLFLTFLGGLTLILTTWLFQQQYLSPTLWMIISGAGLFIPYILFNGIIFDRFIGVLSVTANVGFLMYLSDAFGYLGSVAVLLWKNFGQADISWLSFYIQLCYVAGVVVVVLSVLSGWAIRQSVEQS